MLIFPKRNFARTLSKTPWKKKSRCVLPKWRQNTWRRICGKGFFRKFAGWHLAPSLRITLFTDNFPGFWVYERLQMAISRSCIKRWRSTCEIVFHCIFWLKFCNLYMKLAVSHSCSTKKVFWKNSQNSYINLRSSHLEVFCQKMVFKILQKSQEKIFAGILFLIKLQTGNVKLSEAVTGDGQ